MRLLSVFSKAFSPKIKSCNTPRTRGSKGWKDSEIFEVLPFAHGRSLTPVFLHQERSGSFASIWLGSDQKNA